MQISTWSWKGLAATAALGAGAVTIGVLGASPALADRPSPHLGGAMSAPATPHSGSGAATSRSEGTAGRDARAGSQDPAAGAVRGKVVSRIGLNIRKRPSTSSAVLGGFPSGAIISIRCKASGENVAGNRLWYQLADRPGYVAARYVQNLAPVPYC